MKIYPVLLMISTTIGLQSMETDQKDLSDLHEMSISVSHDISNRITSYLSFWEASYWDIDEILYKCPGIADPINPAREAIKKYCDEDGNTVTHLLAFHTNPDSLFICVREGLISLAQNNDGVTPYDIARAHFDYAIQLSVYNDCDIDKEVRCCFYILVNYINSQAEEKIAVEACCNRHMMYNNH